MRTVSHAHRADPRNVFSELFRRGSTTPADGGDASKGTPREESDEEGAQTEDMEDVDHEGPEDAGVARVWKRGHEDTEE